MLGATITNIGLLQTPSTARLTAVLLILSLALAWLRQPKSQVTRTFCFNGTRGEFTSKKFWIPGLVSLAAFHLLWTGATVFGLPISFLNLGFVTIPVYWQLIFAMPLIGAMGAFLSSRFGGSRAGKVAAGLFPAFPLVIGYPLARVANRIIPFTQNTAPPTLSYTTGLLLMTIAFVGICSALLIGTMPFLRDTRELKNSD
jgi:hypothetical protein